MSMEMWGVNLTWETAAGQVSGLSKMFGTSSRRTLWCLVIVIIFMGHRVAKRWGEKTTSHGLASLPELYLLIMLF